jgi:viroplasmin and RNaseH domain-containing protein
MESKKALVPKNSIEVFGKIIYSEGNQAWNLIKLRKEVLTEFYQLKEKRSKFSYNMVYYRTFEELERAVKKLKREGSALPFLMFLYKDSEAI